MVSFPGSIAFDEFGKPFIILRDQEQQKRLTGNDAIKVSFFIISIYQNKLQQKQQRKSYICMNHKYEISRKNP